MKLKLFQIGDDIVPAINEEKALELYKKLYQLEDIVFDSEEETESYRQDTSNDY